MALRGFIGGDGYGIARPMPAGEMSEWRANWNTCDAWAARVSGEFHGLHQQTHELAAELLALHASGLKDEALARIGELHTLRGALLAKLPAPGAGA